MLTWGNVIAIEERGGEHYWKCVKCSHALGKTSKDWKTYALKNHAQMSKAQPIGPTFATEKFRLREYYCPECGVMFEVLNLARAENDPVTFRLEL